MRRPKGIRWLVGQPIVTAPLVALGAYCLYVWYRDPDAAVLGIAALVAIGWAIEANTKVTEYKAWKRAWDGMAPGGARPRMAEHPVVRVGALIVIALGIGYHLYSNADQPGYQFGLAWLVGGLGILMLLGLFRLIRRAIRALPGGQSRRKARAETVSICVWRPVMAVPNLKRAYEALPGHCRRVLGAGRSHG